MKMELKTKVEAPENRQTVVITRTFDIPVHLLFMAFEKAELVEQWMNTKVQKLDPSRHGSYEFVTTDPAGNRHYFHGVIHDRIENECIVRTFQMAGTPLPAQLEVLNFEPAGESRSKLTMNVIYQSPEIRSKQLQLPFATGISVAHDRLERLFQTPKQQL